MVVSDLKVIDEYDALSVAASQDLTLEEFFIFLIVGETYVMTLNPRSNFKKRRDGKMTYWSLPVTFIGETIKYRESHDKSIINLPLMGNEVLVVGKILASRLRVLMEKNYKIDLITIKIRRVTLRTAEVELYDS